MLSRKKKILIFQFFLLITGIFLIFLTYINNQKSSDNEIISKKAKSEIEFKLNKNKDNENTFYNIEYSGLDLSGNRYILKAREAANDRSNEKLVNLKFVDATFYFKDDTILYVTSDFGLYNNKTLDMIFNKNVIGKYDTSELFAEKAEYSNSKGFLIVSENVKIIDIKGTMLAEKLVFDINNNSLDISSSKRKKINANLNYK
tara:strand:+ start:1014 stop:1619 length:606 start_codon:yes stop_codon:yes gene_type:complete